jgi:hypothetical protein
MQIQDSTEGNEGNEEERILTGEISSAFPSFSSLASVEILFGISLLTRLSLVQFSESLNRLLFEQVADFGEQLNVRRLLGGRGSFLISLHDVDDFDQDK